MLSMDCAEGFCRGTSICNPSEMKSISRNAKATRVLKSTHTLDDSLRPTSSSNPQFAIFVD